MGLVEGRGSHLFLAFLWPFALILLPQSLVVVGLCGGVYQGMNLAENYPTKAVRSCRDRFL